MVILLFWILLAVLVGVYADHKGRSGIGFFFLAILLSPIIAFIIALVVKPSRENLEQSAISSGDMRKCPHCAELVKAEANLCRYCHSELPPVVTAPVGTSRTAQTDEEYRRAYNIERPAK